MSSRRIALVPLDERPVNTGLPADVAATASVELAVPPVALMPQFRKAGDVPALVDWLESEAADPRTSAVIVCIDTLVHGGLVPARVTEDNALDVLPRLNVLRRIHVDRPDLPISAISLVTRATDSYSNVEEPEYWSGYGRDLHRLGGDVHRAWAAAISGSGTGAAVASALPARLRDDFAIRRLRNHQVTLAALDLQWHGVIQQLAITADDTATFSAGSAEQALLNYWRELRPSELVDMYPGADETGATMVARTLVSASGERISVRVVANSAAGMLLVPPYENEPVEQSVLSQLHSSGAESAAPGTAGDLTLIIHTPDPNRGDLFGAPGLRGAAADVAATVTAVRSALDEGADVAVADLRFGNGADAALVEALAAEGLLWRLCAFGGWNTAGNALGSTVALGVAFALAKRQGTLNRDAAIRALARRVVDDYCWQSIQRAALTPSLFDGQIAPVGIDQARNAEPRALNALRSTLRALNPPPSIEISSVSFPWRRSFEVQVGLSGDELIG